MSKHNKPLTTDDGELRDDLTSEELALFKPASSVFTGQQIKKLRGRPKSETTKEQISIRLSPEVLDAFRATGSGWQTRMNEALSDWLKRHDPKSLSMPTGEH